MMISLGNAKNLILLLCASVCFSAVAQAQVVRTSYLVGKSQLPLHKAADVKKIADANPKFKAEFVTAYSAGQRPLMKDWGSSDYQKLSILIRNDKLNTEKVREFRDALVAHKRSLMELYNLENDLYNKLAAMALGIYGNESEFGSSLRFSLKEQNQGLVIALKYLSGDTDPVASRGGTQIKDIPDKIANQYPQITPDTLIVAANSAIATIGFLAETHDLLLRKSRNDRIHGAIGRRNLTYIQPENVFDFIPYVYSGQMRKLYRDRKTGEGATVIDNMYVNGLKKNIKNFYFMEPRH